MRDELIAELMKHLKEEYEDVLSYEKLKEEAKETDDKQLAMFIRMIGRDERSHAAYLTEYLRKHNIEFSNELLALKEKVTRL